MRYPKCSAAPIMPFLGLSHLDVFLGSQPLLSLGFLHRQVPTKTPTRHKQTASNIHSITEVGSTTGDHPVQPPAPSRITRSRLPRTLPGWVQSIFKVANSTTSLGNHMTNLQPLKSSSRPFPALAPASPCPSSCGEPRTGHSTLTVVSSVLSKGE